VSYKLTSTIAVIGIDIGKNSLHVVGHERRGAIVVRQKWSRRQMEAPLANLPPCLIGMEACVGAHHLSRKLQALGHDARLAKYVRPYSKGQKNAAEAIAEAVQRPTMKFVVTKTTDQLDLQALYGARAVGRPAHRKDLQYGDRAIDRAQSSRGCSADWRGPEAHGNAVFVSKEGFGGQRGCSEHEEGR
jgi:hypothetical protein